jgi:hypothetical protein
MSWSLRSSYLSLKVWSHHIYVWKFEVIIFMFGSLRSSYLCLEVWGHHIYAWKFEVIIFMFGSLKSSYLYDDLKLQDINMTTSNLKTKYNDLKLSKHKYDDLKLQDINILCLEVWGHHIYAWKFEVIIFMFGSLKSSYLCLEVWSPHIYVWKFEVVIFRHKYDDLKLEDKI